MIIEISNDEILQALVKQLNSFFFVSEREIILLEESFEDVLRRCEYCFERTENKYYSRNGEAFFNPYHSGQYCIFLYYFSNSIYKQRNNENVNLADKLYYLNKIMNACDLFYEVELPKVFKLDHPVGSVMGRAKYGNQFTFGQNCTVGNNRGIFPSLEMNVKMAANSMILGNCHIGENSIIGAGACVKDENIPKNSLVFGQSPNLIIKKRK